MISFKKNSIGIYVSEDQNYVYFEDNFYKFVESTLGNACNNCGIHDTKKYNTLNGGNCSLDFPCQGTNNTSHPNLRVDGRYGYLKRCDIPPDIRLPDKKYVGRLKVDTRTDEEKLIAQIILG